MHFAIIATAVNKKNQTPIVLELTSWQGETGHKEAIRILDPEKG